MKREESIRTMRAALFLHAMDLQWQFPGSTRVAVTAVEDFLLVPKKRAYQMVQDYRDSTCRFVKPRRSRA